MSSEFLIGNYACWFMMFVCKFRMRRRHSDLWLLDFLLWRTNDSSDDPNSFWLRILIVVERHENLIVTRVKYISILNSKLSCLCFLSQLIGSNSNLDFQKNVIFIFAMRFIDDEAMMREVDEKNVLLKVKLMALAAFCCLHHIFETFLHRERCETMFDNCASYY